MNGYQPRYSPRYAVTVGETTFDEAGGRVANLVVETAMEGADRFSFTLQFPFDEELGTFRGLSWDAISVGTDVSIAMGYGGDGGLTPLLSGRVDSVRASFDRSVGPTVSVSGFGLSRATMAGTNSRSWRDTSIGTVVEDVLRPYALSADVDADLSREWLFQDNRSDYRFLSALAATYGFQWYTTRETVVFQPREQRGGSNDPVADLWYGDALAEFEGEIQRRQAETTVEVRAWCPDRTTEVVATAGPSDGDHTEVFRVPAMSDEEAQTIAEQKHSALENGVIEGHGVADGRPSLRAGETVRLSELGERFSATYQITAATHRMGSSGYETTFEAREVPT